MKDKNFEEILKHLEELRKKQIYYQATVISERYEVVEAQNKRLNHEDAYCIIRLPDINISLKDLNQEQIEKFIKRIVVILEQLIEEAITSEKDLSVQKQRMRMGATLTLTLRIGNTLHAGNSGDGVIFVAVLDANNQIVVGERINNKHDCFNFSERKRLKSTTAGFLLSPSDHHLFGYFSSLATTRALGDLNLRKLKGKDVLIISEPEYYKKVLNIPKGGSAIIITSCDGPFEQCYKAKSLIQSFIKEQLSYPDDPSVDPSDNLTDEQIKKEQLSYSDDSSVDPSDNLTDEQIKSITEKIKSDEEKAFCQNLQNALNNSTSKKNLAERICEEVIQDRTCEGIFKEGSRDNITIVVETLNEHNQEDDVEDMVVVLDGHGGAWVAQKAKELLPKAAQQAFQEVVKENLNLKAKTKFTVTSTSVKIEQEESIPKSEAPNLNQKTGRKNSTSKDNDYKKRKNQKQASNSNLKTKVTKGSIQNSAEKNLEETSHENFENHPTESKAPTKTSISKAQLKKIIEDKYDTTSLWYCFCCCFCCCASPYRSTAIKELLTLANGNEMNISYQQISDAINKDKTKNKYMTKNTDKTKKPKPYRSELFGDGNINNKKISKSTDKVILKLFEEFNTPS